jgi:hypothetical protein
MRINAFSRSLFDPDIAICVCVLGPGDEDRTRLMSEPPGGEPARFDMTDAKKLTRFFEEGRQRS